MVLKSTKSKNNFLISGKSTAASVPNEIQGTGATGEKKEQKQYYTILRGGGEVAFYLLGSINVGGFCRGTLSRQKEGKKKKKKKRNNFYRFLGKEKKEKLFIGAGVRDIVGLIGKWGGG